MRVRMGGMTKTKSQQVKAKPGVKPDGRASKSSKKSSKKDAPKPVVEVKGTWTPEEVRFE